MNRVILRPSAVSLAELRLIWSGAAVGLDPAAYAAIDAAAQSVARIVASGRTVYGINTGFGLLASTRVEDHQLAELQRNLVLSHCCGLGDALPARVVRLIIALKVIGLARGYSGLRREIVDRLLALLDAGLLPVIPAQGSVGASGDLAPLAHVAAVLIGEGQAALGDEVLAAGEALQRLGLEPLVLGPKEGLALINGTQVSAALAIDALLTGERVFGAALLAGAMSVDALKGSYVPFAARLNEARGQPGQIAVAAAMRDLFDKSAIGQSHQDCAKVQDPYSFRCQPQVMGAALDLLAGAARTLEIEANAVSDNPLIFPDTDEALSGGNFHAEPVAFAADIITLALCEIGSLSERRTAVLVDPKMSGLPAFLVADSGLNSGFMIPQVTAAALVSENKSLAFPTSVDSIPTSAGQEDHVSMATHGARKAGAIARNAAGVVGIELLAAAQGLDFHAPLQTSAPLRQTLAEVRKLSAPLICDRYWATDMEALQAAVLDGRFGTKILVR
jgi:histidine ammonia-lyase